MRVLEIGSKSLDEAIKHLKEGKVIVCPTDTVYGLLADVTNEKAVRRVFNIKKRNIKKPIPVFVKDVKAAKTLAVIDKKQEEFLKKVWPGKVTVVLKRKKAKLYGVNKETIALRVPKHELVNKLLNSLSFPLSGTSANISRKPASGKIKEVLKQFQDQKDQPDLVVDAGDLKMAKPSKVIDLTNIKPKVLRK